MFGCCHVSVSCLHDFARASCSTLLLNCSEAIGGYSKGVRQAALFFREAGNSCHSETTLEFAVARLNGQGMKGPVF